jgi:hypothetical protein
MTTKLDRPLKRELSIGGKPYTLTITSDAMHLIPKGHRKGYELAWVDLVSGDAALATALNASLARGPKWEAEKTTAAPAQPKAKRSRRKRAKR